MCGEGSSRSAPGSVGGDACAHTRPLGRRSLKGEAVAPRYNGGVLLEGGTLEWVNPLLGLKSTAPAAL